MSDTVSQRYVGPAITRAISVWGLLILLILLLIVFSLLKPDTFPTYFNIRSILNNKSVQALLALAVFIPMTANHFDLSAGFNLGISQVLAIGLQGQGLPWWAAVIAVLADGRPGRARQRHPRHAGQDRLLHRDARHRHRALRAQRLVHRRPAGARRSAGAVPRHLRQHRPRTGAGAVHARRRASPSGSCSNISRSVAISMFWRKPARGGIERHLGQALRDARASSPPGRSPRSPGSSFNRSSRSARARSARNICCRPSPPLCSARPRSGRVASTSGARSSPSPFSR